MEGMFLFASGVADVLTYRWQFVGSHLPPAPVAQLDRAFGYEPKGRTFESCRAHH